MGKPFAEGDLALLIDQKDRRYLVRLAKGKSFHTHMGALPHDGILGAEDGARVRTVTGHELTALRPTLAEYILKMGRGAQVIYPKDIGPMLVWGDIYPGASVIEAGAGSGALTMALLRAVGPTGRVTTYEIREDLAVHARRNVKEFLGESASFTLKIRDIYEGASEREVDRVVLDLPEPWRAVEMAGVCLRQGGMFIAYVPTVLQIHQLHAALARDERFDFIESFEVIQRPWYLAPTSARPVHRMVAHTGFILRAIRCEPRKRRETEARQVEDETPANMPEDIQDR